MPHVSEPHAQHDPLLVASLAAGDLAGAERDRATAQVASCADCGELHADLILIARATAALPPAVAPRDFTLTPEQAAALRPGGWRRLVAAISGSRPLMSRQLGIGLTTIGLAGLLVSTLPSIQLGNAGSGTAAAPAQPGEQAPPAAAAAGSASGGGETSTDTNTASGGPVGVTGDGASPVPALLGTLPSAAPSARVAAPVAGQSSAGGYGTYGGAKAAASTAPTTAGRNNYDAAGPTANPEGVAAPQDSRLAAKEPTSGRDLILAGSLVLLWAGIALLVIRQLVRRSIQH
jgi:hypothetical protein